ncbi:MAG: sulfotransferase [Paracoccaceae bacterium]
MSPTVIGIGAQKCASSWVHSVLGAHPEIGVSDPKELDFFSHYFDHGYQWYDSHFSDLSGFYARCETSPSYFYDPRAAQRVWDYNKDMKIIALLRDPVERAYSNHLHEVIKGHIPCQSFEQGLKNNPAYIDQGRYYSHLKPWFSTFGPDQILVLIAEEVFADPAAAAAQLYEFIGVDTGFVSAVASQVRNISDRARLPGLRRTLRSSGDLMRRVGLEEQLGRLKSTAPVASLLRMNSINARTEVPAMAQATRQDLSKEFAPEMVALGGLLKRSAFPWPTWETLGTDTQQSSSAV